MNPTPPPVDHRGPRKSLRINVSGTAPAGRELLPHPVVEQPVVDQPAIQYVVEEATAAGLTDVLMITGRNKRPLEDHFDRNYELEEALHRKGDDDRLSRVQASNDLATIHYVRQGDPKGLGHAVLCAAPHVGDQPFAVLLGDDLIDPRDPLLDPVWARLAGQQVPVVVHCGGGPVPGPFTGPGPMGEVLARHP